MAKRLQGLLAGVIIGALLAGGTVLGATTQRLDAVFSGIKLNIDGRAVTPKDASGKTVEPFIVDGTTYLPVRAVAEALGKLVSWDSATQTVSVRNNQFISDTRSSAENKVTVSSKNIYFDGDKLRAEMFVDNGLDVPVYNLRDITITLSNDAGTIAKAKFTSMEGAMIAANSYITWHFNFPEDTITTKGADLTGRIRCETSISYSH